jgi:hypothetical protein
MLPTTDNRVRSHTAPEINRRIDGQFEASIRYHALHPEKIDQRLFELDREWDIERALEANAASISVFGVLMGLMGRRIFFLLPGIVGGFLLQHAICGWCPPAPLLRRLGFRTSSEIHRERYALKALRGDFAGIARGDNGASSAAAAAHDAVQATRH